VSNGSLITIHAYIILSHGGSLRPKGECPLCDAIVTIGKPWAEVAIMSPEAVEKAMQGIQDSKDK